MLATAVETLLSSPPTDLLRLTVVPVFLWAAYRDIQTRRVRDELWAPLLLLGVVVLAVDGLAAVSVGGPRLQLFGIHLAVSLGIVAPLGYLFWRLGGFGGADAKAIIVLALVFPEFPVYLLANGSLPLTETPLGVFSMTVLSNAVLVGLISPLLLAGRNLLAGRVSLAMFVGRPASVSDVGSAYGNLLETPDGLTRRGLDLDALRMYLRWRQLTLADIRADPARYRHPGSILTDAGDPTDGALAAGPDVADGSLPGADTPVPAVRLIDPDDPWGAAAFLAAIDSSAYGTTPEQLREGLDVLAERDTVWLTPGLPFIVPITVGLLVALVYGDLLYALLGALGAAP
ncbi:MAG: A24 family peptidase C-terminal domain-containing protein [Halobacteriales archaeon]|nr:A24 family peptidase C-terminal domain-containing protein [Halobacteriales archaeon]